MTGSPVVDPSQTIINARDEPSRPPPTLEVGLLGWMRQNLFSSPSNVIITLVSGLLILVMVYGFFHWSVSQANWFAVINNQRLFMMESFEPEFEWRIALTVMVSAILTGLSLAAWARPLLRGLAGVVLALLTALALLPALINGFIDQPSSYFTAGNVEILDRASTLEPQRNLAFIAEAGETVELRLALDEVASIETLSDLDGFSDRATNALANAARNRIAQQALTSQTFDQMRSGQLTETLEERTRLQIRTFTRTNDMLAATAQYVISIGGRLTAPDSQVAELRYWLERLERAARALDPRETAILEALAPVEDAADKLSINELIPADLREAVSQLTSVVLASEQLEDLGETFVLQLSEDFIGEPNQRDDDEELITPSEREAAFLRDLFTRLLTPQSVLALYEPGKTPMTVAIRDGRSLDVLAKADLASAEDALRYEIPADGWYVLSKDAAPGESGTAILAARGIYPVTERTLSATESRYTRPTHRALIVAESAPMIDGKEAQIARLIDNQFRGSRDFAVYLAHFIPTFALQIESLLLPFFVIVVWGYLLGRALSHLLGERADFSESRIRLTVFALSFAPFLVLLIYQSLYEPVGAIGGLAAVVFKLAAAYSAVLLARLVEARFNRANRGEGAEGSLNRLLLYGWGIFPIFMFGAVSGIGGFSGGTLGSVAGGLVWLLLMMLIGLNFRGAAGYVLLAAGFFAQVAQAAVINLVWEGWSGEPIASLLIWLVAAACGILAGILGERRGAALDANIRRYGYLIACLAFGFVLLDTGLSAGGSTPAMPAVAIAFWLAWMFFCGATGWTSNRAMVGLLLLTYLWMQAWTGVDRWSTIYFLVWLAAGAWAFKRGERAQIAPRKQKGVGASVAWLFHYPRQSLIAAGVAWLLALLILPSLTQGLDALGILQSSPDDLLPLSDKRLWGGLMLTMQLTVLGIGASFPIGLGLALGRRSNLPVVKYVCILYIEVVRGVPLITVLFLATLMVPLVDPTLATIEGAVRAWVGITLFSAAYLAENVRGGLQSLDRGQTEAAQALGLSGWQTTVHILLPQALRAVIPALVGQFISLFKDTSLVYIVGLAEILGIANRVVAQSEFLGRRQETYLYVTIIFFAFSYVMSYVSRRIEATGSGAARATQI